MDRMLYVAGSGAQETMYAQSLHANNLANVNTTGFRAQLQNSRSMPVYGPGHPSRVYVGTETPGDNFSSGSFKITGNALDVAISGPGWLAVQAADGSEAYTRRGDLRIN
jgi:flagellar basal-body rod protein FlgF